MDKQKEIIGKIFDYYSRQTDNSDLASLIKIMKEWYFKIEELNKINTELNNKINKLELSELKYLDQIYTKELKIKKLNDKIISIKDYLYSYYDVESENFILNDEDIYSELMEKLKED